jgi:hypothetical protein
MATKVRTEIMRAPQQVPKVEPGTVLLANGMLFLYTKDCGDCEGLFNLSESEWEIEPTDDTDVQDWLRDTDFAIVNELALTIIS